jgi:hypothetical protein
VASFVFFSFGQGNKISCISRPDSAHVLTNDLLYSLEIGVNISSRYIGAILNVIRLWESTGDRESSLPNDRRARKTATQMRVGCVTAPSVGHWNSAPPFSPVTDIFVLHPAHAKCQLPPQKPCAAPHESQMKGMMQQKCVLSQNDATIELICSVRED